MQTRQREADQERKCKKQAATRDANRVANQQRMAARSGSECQRLGCFLRYEISDLFDTQAICKTLWQDHVPAVSQHSYMFVYSIYLLKLHPHQLAYSCRINFPLTNSGESLQLVSCLWVANFGRGWLCSYFASACEHLCSSVGMQAPATTSTQILCYSSARELFMNDVIASDTHRIPTKQGKHVPVSEEVCVCMCLWTEGTRKNTEQSETHTGKYCNLGHMCAEG